MEINLDKNVRLEDDFNKSVNGKWLDNNQIPEDYTIWGTFTELMEENYKKIETLIEELVPTTIEENQIIKLWKSADTIPNIEEDFIEKMKYFNNKIDDVNTIPQLLKLMAYLNTYNIDSFFSFYSGPDSKQSNISIPNIHSNGINLPDRDYYLDKENQEILSNYSKFITNMNSILMEKNIGLGENITSKIIEIETELAKSKWSKVEARDRDTTYNKLTLLELNNLTKKMNWKKYLTELGIEKLSTMDNKYYIIDNPKYISNLDNLFSKFPLDDIKIYLKWCVVLHFSSYLPNKLGNEYFDFYGRKLSGQQKPKPYWKRKISWCNKLIGEQIGKIYVKRYFPPSSKDKVKEMVETIIESFKERLSNVDWMEKETKKKALVKLSKFNVKMGYPDKWRDYSDLEIGNSLIENLLNIGKNEWEYELKAMYQPVDKDKWEMHPQEINAYFYPEMNEIVFPAAILQPPFFSPNYDNALNYGGIGAVIGHELTHGYDDQGRKYDEEGNLNEWWSKKDKMEFDKRTKLIIEQFDNCKLLGEPVNGELTQGENIADLGGLIISYNALQKIIPKNTKKIDNYTQSQRFFFTWARLWRNKIRDEELLMRLKIDPHSPGELRINMPLTNMEEFYQAFNITEKDGMYRTNRVNIW